MMFNRLFASRITARKHRPAPQRCRLGVELLEDRLVLSTTPALVGLQTQTLANPTNTVTSQVIVAGSYAVVASQTVTVDAGKTGLYNLAFQAQAFSGITNRVGVRYLIDGNYDPNDAAVTRSGTTADTIEDISAGGWQTLFLNHQLALSAGTHTISVEVECTGLAVLPGQELVVHTPVLDLVAANVVDSHAAAVGVQAQTVIPGSGTPGQQVVSAGAYQTVVSQQIVVGSGSTGLYDLNFQAQAFAGMTNRVFVRYLVDGQTGAGDLAISGSPGGADTVEDFSNGFGSGAWHTLFLTHQLALSAGTHTISIQVMCNAHGFAGQDLIVFTPTLDLTGYNVVDGQHAADGVQTQGSGSQVISGGSFQTVASAQVAVGSNKTGVYDLAFQAQAFSSVGNSVFVRYLIDGRLDPNDEAVNFSPNAADTTVDYLDSLGSGGAWHTLQLDHLITLSAGTHTITIQVECTSELSTGRDLGIFTPDLHLTGFNNIGTTTPTTNSTFNYDATTGLLTINGTGGNDQFRMTQATTDLGGALATTYTFNLNGVSASYSSSQLTNVIVNGNGGSDMAGLYTNDTYVGSDGLRHETPERLLVGAGGALLQKLDAGGNAVTFLQLKGFTHINAVMGQADSASMYDSPGNDSFVTAGLSRTMSGAGYANTVTGAGSVTGYSIYGGQDTATQYDGSGASVYTVSGTSSTMTGTDQGLPFANQSVGFHFNYGLARHTGDVAHINSAGNSVFVGMTHTSYLYNNYLHSSVAFMDQVSGFSQVLAASSAAGTDLAYDYAPTVNTVTGFRRLV